MGGQAEILPGIPGMMGFPAKGVGFLVRGRVGRSGQGRSQAPHPNFPMSLEGVQAAEVTSLAGLPGAGR